MKLKQIIDKLKCIGDTTVDTKYYVEVDSLLNEIKKAQIEAKKNKEFNIIKRLGFKEVKDKEGLWKFSTDEEVLFFDYRNGKRKSFAVDIDNKPIIKTNIEVYNIFKLVMSFR